MNEIDFINKWSPNGFEEPYPNYCFKLDLKELIEQIRAEVNKEIYSSLMSEIAELNELEINVDNLISFVYRVKQIAEQLMEKVK